MRERVPGEDYGLGEMTGILVQSDKLLYLTECEGRFYIWSAISDYMFRIEEPVDLKEIVEALDEKSERKLETLQLEMLPPDVDVGSPEELTGSDSKTGENK